MLVADPGFGLMNVDLSQAEARIVALLAEDYDLLALFSAGIDVHALTASWIFGGKIESHFKVKGVEPPSRFTGKTVRHAGDYDMQKHRCMLEINSNARRGHIGCKHDSNGLCDGSYFNVSEWKSSEILRIFHAKSPKIRGVYHAEIQKIGNTTRELRNPFGRVRRFFERPGEDLYKEMYAHIPQSTTKDHLTLAMLRVKKRIPEIRYVLEAHDAACFFYPLGEEKRYADTLTEELIKPINFELCTLQRGELIIPCDVEIGLNYKDFQKWKAA